MLCNRLPLRGLLTWGLMSLSGCPTPEPERPHFSVTLPETAFDPLVAHFDQVPPRWDVEVTAPDGQKLVLEPLDLGLEADVVAR